ncbi:nucleotidyltransferase domain-containing protein [Lysobacter korlensis]|uniref:Nucleotidyltransferase domain-containing protein n=1 Tax=Lysobacter korlensis TaxID=553636 RepID=A0ABV6RNH5_9GAMM
MDGGIDRDGFAEAVATRLGTLHSVEAVTLGGSRAEGTHRPDSDWDFAVYYRGDFEPENLRSLAGREGWEGEISEIGGWGGGVFNGGAWLTIGGRQVDVHYRDLDAVEAEIRRTEAGEFHIEPLMFHLAGIPSYLVVGELAMNRVLSGSLPKPEYPEQLRRTAGAGWAGRAEMTLRYAEHSHAPAGRLAQCTAQLVVAATEYAHAILAARGEWTTNEKRMLDRAGLRGIDDIVAGATPDPMSLRSAVTATRELGRARL